MTTPILNLKEIPDGMEKPQLILNQDLRYLEAASNAFFVANLSAGNLTITDAVDSDPALSFVFSRYFVYRASGHTVARDLTIPQKLRSFVVDNAGTAEVSVKRGSSTVVIAAGASGFLYADGTANGLKLISVLGAAPVVSGAEVVVKTGTTYDVDSADNTKYLRFTSTSAKTITVRANATHALPANFEINLRNAAAENATISPAGGVTVAAPYGGTLVIPPQGTVTLKRAASDVFDLIGATVPL